MDGEYDRDTGEVIEAPRNGMPTEIAKAVIAVMREVRTLGTDTRNEHARYNYVSIDKFLEAIGPKLAEHGLIITQDEVAAEIKAGVPDDQGKVKSALYVRYAFGLVHESGTGWGPVYRSVALPATGPQSFGSAESYMMKRFMRSLFMVPTGEKDADEEASSEMPSTGRIPARTAQERPSAAMSSRTRPQAAPARTPGQEKAVARYKELAATIAETEDTGELTALDASLDSDLALMAAMPEETAVLVNQLHDRIEAQRKHLFGATG